MTFEPFYKWRDRVRSEFPDARIDTMHRGDSCVGASAMLGDKEVSAWPGWKKPGYEVLPGYPQ